LGTVDLEDNSARLKIEATVAHPYYDKKVHNYDIALVKLIKPVSYSKNIKPSKLPENFDSLPKNPNECVSAGWGLIDKS